MSSQARSVSRGTGKWMAATAVALAAAAVVANRAAAKAERDYPPKGRFVNANGIKLHVLEEGEGAPVVFIHGNGAMIDDMLISGIFGQTAARHRAIAFDRVGFGHTARPRGTAWSAREQAALLPALFSELGITRPIVVGHSWGTLVALALAIDHPECVGGLVLASGYYFPTVRLDTAMSFMSTVPVAGDVINHTLSPLLGWLLAPLLIKPMFSPKEVPARFQSRFPIPMTLRPGQIRAFSEDTVNLPLSARELCGRYHEIACPVAIIAGDADQIVEHEQATRLHAAIKQSTLDIVQGDGHMFHYAHTQRLSQAIETMSPVAA